MRSLERRFIKMVKSNPCASDYLCFVMAISGQKFNNQIIARWFNKLVSKDDYDKRDKRLIVSHLLQLSKHAEDNQI